MGRLRTSPDKICPVCNKSFWHKGFVDYFATNVIVAWVFFMTI